MLLSSVVRKMPGYNSQRRGTARTSQFFIFIFIVMYVPFSVFCVLFVCKYVLYYCHQVSTQLQLKINLKQSHILLLFLFSTNQACDTQKTAVKLFSVSHLLSLLRSTIYKTVMLSVILYKCQT
jgi:hypothetical protein